MAKVTPTFGRTVQLRTVWNRKRLGGTMGTKSGSIDIVVYKRMT